MTPDKPSLLTPTPVPTSEPIRVKTTRPGDSVDSVEGAEPIGASPQPAGARERYERRSLIVSSNKTFSAWAEIFGDPVAIAAMVDRLVHHAEVIVLRGDSFRLRGKRQEVLTGEKER